MSLTRNKLSGQTANRDIYRRTFLRHVHRLLQLGYESLIPTEFTHAEEDDITGKICERMKELTEVSPTEKWMARYSIHDQDPVNKVTAAQTGKERRGKRRPKLDIRLVCKSRVPNTQFCVEAKRLYCSNSVSEYMDDEGLGAFMGDYYAKDDDAAGMLGYVQTDCVDGWLAKVQKKLSQDSTVVTAWGSSKFHGGPPHTYLTVHRRANGDRKIEIFHVFFVFS
jgi:hypothetical protein